ncbi:MAG: O-antigen ligase family protein [Pseudomonadota bacterium]
MAVLLLSSQSAASLVTYILALAMLLRVSAWRDVFHCPMVWPVVALLIYLPLTTLWSTPFEPREVLTYGARGLLIFCFVVAAAECQLRGEVQRGLGLALGVAAATLALLTIPLFYLYPPEDGRLNGLGQLDTHVVAGLVYGAALIMIAHALLQRRTPLWTAVGLCCVALLAVAVWLTNSLNAWVSVLSGVLVLLAAHTLRRVGVFVAVIGALACVAAIAAATLVLQFVDDPESVRRLLPRGDSFREVLWRVTLERVADAPWFGNGIATVDDVDIGHAILQHPHSMYLAVLFQGGVFGLVLFVWLILRTLRELLKNYALGDAKLGLAILAVGLPSYLLDGHELVDKISDTWFLFWLPVALALGLRWHPGLRS